MNTIARQPNANFANGATVYKDSGINDGWNYKNVHGIVSYYPSREAAMKVAIAQCGQPVKLW